MNINDCQNMYDKMVMPREMDERMQKAILNRMEEKRDVRKKGYRAGFAVAAAFAVMVCIAQFDSVSAAAERVMEYFRYTFLVENQEGNVVEVNMEGNYLTLDSAAPKNECYMDSITMAGEKMGVKLLEADKPYLYDECVNYTPYLTEDDELYGVMLSNKLYATGDLQNVSLHQKGDEGGLDWIEYTAGVNYQTPISVQVTIRTDKDMTGEYDNNEIGYVSKSQNIDLTNPPEGISDAEIYEMSHLGVNAVLYSVQTDGPIAWNIEEGAISCTTAIFVYQGIEYVYMGGVNHDTMKLFLDTLR